jgi:hypothetical protein
VTASPSRRLQKALQEFAPAWVAWVEDPVEADLEILHVLGAGEPPK